MNRRFGLVVALSMFMLLSRGVDMWHLARNTVQPLHAGFAAAVRDGSLVVTEVAPRDLAGGITPAAAAGLRAGDRIVAIQVPGGPVYRLRSMGEAADGLHAAMAAGAWMLVVERPEDGGSRTLSLMLRRGARDPARTALRLVLGGLLPLVAILTALLIAWLKPADPVALLASFLFLSFSALFGGEIWLLPRPFWEVGIVVHTCLFFGFGYLFLHFFLVFPRPSVIDRRLPWLKRVILVPVIVLAVGSAALEITWVYSFAKVARLEALLGRVHAETAYWALTLVMQAIGMVSLGTQLLRADTPGDRRRVAILLAGTVTAFVPFLALTGYMSIMGYERTALWWLAVVVPLLLLFPLSFVYVVVRHRVLGVEVILRRGVRYALVSRGFLGIEGVVLFIALYFGVGPLLVTRFPGAGAGVIATTNAMAALVAMAGVERVNRRLRPVIDRRFFRGRYNPQQVLGDVGAVLKQHATEPHLLIDIVAERLATALKASTCGAFLEGRPREPEARTDDKVPAGATVREYACEAWVALDSRTGQPFRPDTRPKPLGLPADAPLLRATTRIGVGREPVLELDPTDVRAWLRQIESEPSMWPSAAVRRESAVPDFETFARIGARLVAPIASQQRILGWLVLGDRLSEEAYSPEDKDLVRAVARQVATALEYATLIGQVAEREALRRELEIARQVQSGLFPRRRPRIRSLEYDGICRTAQEVGGDYFDFLDLGPARLVLAIGDISGKGVSAALLMASLQALLRSRAPGATGGLDALMAEINRLLLASIDPSKFASLFYSVFDGDARTLTFVNAGHNPPLLFRNGEDAPQRLAPTGPALGLMAGVSYHQDQVRLAPGDLLVLYTDGVTEAMDSEGEEYGEPRLADAIRGHRHLPAAALRDAILDDLDRFVGAAAPHDDVTLVAARVTA